MEDVILEDERVKLLPLSLELAKELFPFSLNEPETWEFSLQSAAGITNMDAYVKSALKARAEGTTLPFIVLDKETNSYAGSTRFYDYKATHKSVLLGYTWYGKAYRGTGLNYHCKYLLLQYAFETLGLMRVEFRADNNNERSKKAMLKIGVTPEGILRSDCSTIDGHRRDSAVFSILASEWKATVKDKIQSLMIT